MTQIRVDGKRTIPSLRTLEGNSHLSEQTPSAEISHRLARCTPPLLAWFFPKLFVTGPDRDATVNEHEQRMYQAPGCRQLDREALRAASIGSPLKGYSLAISQEKDAAVR
jgi:hypothetical protein